MSSLCSFPVDAAIHDVTPIENIFLIEYLSTAPEDCLRVYLYMRMICLHPELGADMDSAVKTLNLSEDAILNAMQYWEQAGLARRLTDRPPTFECLRVHSLKDNPLSGMDQTYYRFRDFNAKLQAFFKTNDLISPKEYATAADWVTELHFEQDAALRIVQYVMENGRGKKPESVFKRADKLALEWADKGISTLDQVEHAILFDTKYARAAQAITKRFNMRRLPSEDEINLVARWMGEWNYTEEQILDLCRTTTAAQYPSFNYLNSVLQNRLSGTEDLRTDLAGILRELDPKNAVPTPEQLRRYGDLLALGYNAATVKLAAIQCHESKRYRFEDMERMIRQWNDRRLITFDEVSAYLAEMNPRKEQMLALFEHMGVRKNPSRVDVEEILPRWRALANADLLMFAADLSRGKAAPLEYFEALLNKWHAAGIDTPDAAKAQRSTNNAAHKTAQQNPALDYDQRSYTAEDFGDDFFTDPDEALRIEKGDPK